jgi:uncharacterized protein (UPF0335 family)
MQAGIAEERLRSYIDRIIRLNEDGRAINRDKADAFAEAKSAGFDTAIMKTVIKRLAQAQEVVDLSDALVETYERAYRGGALDPAAVQDTARRQGRADAKAGTTEHQHLYPNGKDGSADYELGRQDVWMANQTDANGAAIGDPKTRKRKPKTAKITAPVAEQAAAP